SAGRLPCWSGPCSLAVLGVHAEEFVALGKAEQQIVLEHRRVELDGRLLVGPQFFGRKAATLLIDFHGFGTAATASIDNRLTCHERSGGVVSHSLGRERRLPGELAIPAVTAMTLPSVSPTISWVPFTVMSTGEA